MVNLISHLQEEDQIEIRLQNLNFTNLEYFNEWKTKEERSSKAYFVQHTASKVYEDNTHWYFSSIATDLVSVVVKVKARELQNLKDLAK